jgi:hypothetical protein
VLAVRQALATGGGSVRVPGGRGGLVVALAVALVAGLGLAGGAVSGGAVAPVLCRVGQIGLAVGPLVVEKTQQHTAAFALTSSAHGRCALDGYPRVVLLDAQARPLPFSYEHGGDQMITSEVPAKFVVEPGRSAFFEVNKNACIGFTKRLARMMRVGLPGGLASQSIRLPRSPIIDYCPASDPGHAITVSPLEPRLSAAACLSTKPCGPASSALRHGAALPEVGVIMGTRRFSLGQTMLFAAREASLFVLVAPPHRAASITVVRLGAGGGIARSRVPFARSNYLADISSGPDGIYAGTAVIKRFTRAADELVRIDPKTLTIGARARFASGIATVEQGQGMWASLADGRVMRLDPLTLAIKASHRLIPAAQVTKRGLALSRPALGFGSLWVLAGDARDLELVRIDPVSLAVRSKTHLPTSLARAVHRVVAGSRRVYLVGSAIARVNSRGKLIGRPITVPGLASAEPHGTRWLGLTCCKPALVLFNARGRILARTPLPDSGTLLAARGENAWLLGNAGHGNGIIHVRLNR